AQVGAVNTTVQSIDLAPLPVTEVESAPVISSEVKSEIRSEISVENLPNRILANETIEPVVMSPVSLSTNIPQPENVAVQQAAPSQSPNQPVKPVDVAAGADALAGLEQTLNNSQPAELPGKTVASQDLPFEMSGMTS